jgi:hypothetical protein
MSFIPAAAPFSNSSLLTPAGTPPLRAAAMSNNFTDKRMATLKPTPDSLTARSSKGNSPELEKHARDCASKTGYAPLLL